MKKKMMNSLVLVAAFAVRLTEAFTWAVNPNYYEIVSLNDFCDNKENKKDLRNTSQSKSAAIVTATQFRDMRGSIKDGCSIDLSTKGTAGLIVSLVEMNLRSGVLNRSCIDYVNIVTKFHIPSDKDERCGRVHADEYRYFATSQSLQLRLHSRTPLSTFFDGYTLAVVVTSFTEASSRDGGCAPHEFQCVAGGRCIYKHYQCDHINNCGDNSDEEQLGNSMCLKETSYRYQPLQAAALRLSARAAAGARVTSANSYNHREGDPVPEAEQGAVRDLEDILDPRAVLTHVCLPSAMVCSKEISTRPGHPRSRAPNHRAIVKQLRAEIADLRKSQQVLSPSPSNTVPCTEATSDASHDVVPMDVHPGAKPTKTRALAQPANNEDRDFKTEVKETLNDIKNALRAVVESIAVLDSRVTKIEADQVKALQSAEATPAQVIPKATLEDRTDTETPQNPSSATVAARRSTVSLEENEPGGLSEEAQSEAITPEAEAPLSGISPVDPAGRSLPRPYHGALFSSMIRKKEPEEQVPLSPTS
ncbi:hypothetical protein MRX96_052703 [Rhipicephalus microplus]